MKKIFTLIAAGALFAGCEQRDTMEEPAGTQQDTSPGYQEPSPAITNEQPSVPPADTPATPPPADQN